LLFIIVTARRHSDSALTSAPHRSSTPAIACSPHRGYGGSMLLEGFVANMGYGRGHALHRSVLRGELPRAVKCLPDAVRTITWGGFPVTAQTMADLAHSVGEFYPVRQNRRGPSLALEWPRIFGAPTQAGSKTFRLLVPLRSDVRGASYLDDHRCGTRVGRDSCLQDRYSMCSESASLKVRSSNRTDPNDATVGAL